jgi:hypothetical protein
MEPKHMPEKDSLFKKCFWKNWISRCRWLNLDVCLSPFTNINLKWIRDLGKGSEMLKLQEVVENTLYQIHIGNNFLNRTQKAQHLRERMNKWDSIKLEILNSKVNCHQTRETGHRMGENICWLLIQWGTRIYRELKNLIPQTINTQMKKWYMN